MAVRNYTFTVSADRETPSPRVWGGMQYEDNATLFTFVMDPSLKKMLGESALFRIDFNTVDGWNPSENLTPSPSGAFSRPLPYSATRFGNEVEVVFVITDRDAEILSFPVKVHLTSLKRSPLAEDKPHQSLSAMEESVRSIRDEILSAGVSAEELTETKNETQNLVLDIEGRLERGEFKGEPGKTPDVVEKANLELTEITPFDINYGTNGRNIHTLINIKPLVDNNFELIFTDCQGLLKSTSLDKFAELGYIVGNKYLLDITSDGINPTVLNSVKAVKDVSDKLNKSAVDKTYSPESLNPQSGKAVAEAISTVAQKEWELIEDITLTEAVTEIRIPKGNLRFKEIHIESLVIPSDTTITSQSIRLTFEGSQLWTSQASPKSTGKLYFVADLYISPDNKIFCDGNLTSYYYTTSNAGSNFKAVSTYFMNDARNYNYISSVGQDLKFNTSENGFAAGTKFKVWGR